MLKQQRSLSMRLISVFGVLIVVVIAAAVAVTISLYHEAVDQGADARAADINSQRALQLTSIFAEQRLVMFRYIATAMPSALTETEQLNTQFHQVAAVVSQSAPAHMPALTDALAAQARYYADFQADRHFATASAVRKFVVIGQLDEHADPVTAPLATLVSLEGGRATASVVGANDYAGQGQAIVSAAAILAVLAGLAFAWFMAGTLRRAQQREQALTAAL